MSHFRKETCIHICAILYLYDQKSLLILLLLHIFSDTFSKCFYFAKLVRQFKVHIIVLPTFQNDFGSIGFFKGKLTISRPVRRKLKLFYPDCKVPRGRVHDTFQIVTLQITVCSLKFFSMRC